MAEKHLKKCSKSLVVREIKIKKTLTFHFTPIRMAKIKISDDNTGKGLNVPQLKDKETMVHLYHEILFSY